MAGPLVLNAWQYSNEKGELSREQVLSSIMLLEKKICYKERLKCYNSNTIKSIIEGRIRTEKYLEKKNGGKTNKWDIRTA